MKSPGRNAVAAYCAFGLVVFLAGCLDGVTAPDGGGASLDSGSGAADSGMLDAGLPDAGQGDGGVPDAGTPDSGLQDTGVTDGGLDLNDVSFLFPLPSAPARVGDLLSVGASGPRGPLLPRARFDAILYFAPARTADALYAALRVVSVRFDPCFPRGVSPAEGCAKQIRLVAQPVVPGGGVPVLTLDAPIHLLYELTDAEFREAHLSLFELKRMSAGLTDGRPLEVHPVMKLEGLTGPYARKLIEIVQRYCGDANLVRIATMPLVANDVEWRFAAVDVAGTVIKTVNIPRLPPSTVLQQVIAFGGAQLPAMTLVPSPPTDEFRRILDGQELPLLDAGVVRAGMATALLLENPDRRGVHEVDCGSCHLATRTRLGAERHLGIDSTGFPEAFRSNPRFNLTLVDDASDAPQLLRAFGYFGPSGAWNQRTINESARVAEALSVPPSN